jgi:hypothetical protein
MLEKFFMILRIIYYPQTFNKVQVKKLANLKAASTSGRSRPILSKNTQAVYLHI